MNPWTTGRTALLRIAPTEKLMVNTGCGSSVRTGVAAVGSLTKVRSWGRLVAMITSAFVGEFILTLPAGGDQNVPLLFAAIINLAGLGIVTLTAAGLAERILRGCSPRDRT